MPLDPRTRFLLATGLVLTMLVWPSAIVARGLNTVPYVTLLIALVGFVSLAVRIVMMLSRQVATDRKSPFLDAGLLVVALVCSAMSTTRPRLATGNRPPGATFGPMAELYDPCERYETSVVCSKVIPAVGYECHDGYTRHIATCKRGTCADMPDVPIAFENAGTLRCEEIP